MLAPPDELLPSSSQDVWTRPKYPILVVTDVSLFAFIDDCAGFTCKVICHLMLNSKCEISYERVSPRGSRDTARSWRTGLTTRNVAVS